MMLMVVMELSVEGVPEMRYGPNVRGRNDRRLDAGRGGSFMAGPAGVQNST
jgi:hypothetical protein